MPITVRAREREWADLLPQGSISQGRGSRNPESVFPEVKIGIFVTLALHHVFVWKWEEGKLYYVPNLISVHHACKVSAIISIKEL